MEEIKQFINTLIDNKVVSAASVSLLADNKTFTYSLGKTSFEQNAQPISDETLFDLASLTKVISTTTMILLLQQDKKIDIEDKVNKYLTDYPYDTTIKQLLIHTSGYPADDKAYKLCKDKQQLRQFINSLPLTYLPDSKVEYSDFNYILLGFIIETLETDLQKFSCERIFKPLEMNHTMYCPLEKGYSKDNIAATEVTEARGTIIGECHDGKGFILKGVSGNAGLFSTANDLAKFCWMILSDDESVLTNETKRLFKHSYTSSLNINRTLGWLKKDPTNTCGKYANGNYIYHTGFTGGSVYIDFDRQLALIFLTNRVHPTRNNPAIFEARNQLHDLVLKSNL